MNEAIENAISAKCLKENEPIDFTDVVPGNVSGLLFFGLSSVNRFYTDYRNYLGNTSELARKLPAT